MSRAQLPYGEEARNDKLAPVGKRAVAAGIAIFLCSACGSSNEYVEPPPPTVSVAPPESRVVKNYLEFTGTTDSIRTIEIRARIRGFLQQIAFDEGSYVEEGDLLYLIEPDEYAAAVKRAEAALSVAKTSSDLARATLARMKKAFESRAISEIDLLESQSRADAAAAQIDSARAELETAQLNLSYTTIRAPAPGRVGRTLVDPGNLVGANENTLLTTLVQYDPIYAYFDVNERDLLELMGRSEAARSESDRVQRMRQISLELGRANDEDYPFQGELDYSDQEVDAGTGTFLLRGRFPNPQPLQLLPGLFVRLRMSMGRGEQSLLVNERSIGSDQSGKYVLVVGDDSIVEHRPVKLGPLVDGMRVIRAGLAPSDLVIVDGLLRARPGARVDAQRPGQTPPVASPAEAEG